MVVKFLIFLIVIHIVWVAIDNYKIKQKANMLLEKAERLSAIAGIKCSFPKGECTDELKIAFLENQIRNLEFLILDPNRQDKDLRRCKKVG